MSDWSSGVDTGMPYDYIMLGMQYFDRLLHCVGNPVDLFAY